MRKQGKYFLLISFFLLLAARLLNAESSIEKIILISVDTLRADYLGCYNSKMKTSPNLDRFASENILFLHDTAQAPTTAPSHKSIFYSLYPSIHKTTIHSVPEEKLESPVQILRENGFATAAFTGGGQLNRSFGFARGFDSYWELPAQGNKKQHLDQTREVAFNWLEKHYQEKFFLFLHTYEVHCPYDPPDAFFKKWASWYAGDFDRSKCQPNLLFYGRLTNFDYRYIRDLYSAEINYVDTFVGELFKKLQALDIYDHTLIIFISDHGESLGERNYVGHNQLYEVQLHVPWIMHVPGIRAARIEAPVESIDVMPTVFELLGIKNASFPFQGMSLKRMINSMTPNFERAIISEARGRARIRIGNLALIFSPDGKIPEELYNLKTDPQEMENIADRNPKTVERMKSPYFQMMAMSKNLSAQFVLTPGKKPELSEETSEQLKALGYVAQ